MIGPFNDTGLVFGVLPACLQLGSNPADITTGNIPAYSPNNDILATIVGSTSYSAGKIAIPTASALVTNYVGSQINVTTKMTIMAWVEFPLSDADFHILLNIPGILNFEISPKYNSSTGVGKFLNQLYTTTQSPRARNDVQLSYGLPETGVHLCTHIKNEANLIDYLDADLCNYYWGLYYPNVWVPYNPNQWQAGVIATPSSGYSIGSTRSGLTDPLKSNLHGFLLYNRALSQSEIQALTALGPTLGDIRGYDNGDSTMKLMPMRNWFIM
jgi:hypothetical protein